MHSINLPPVDGARPAWEERLEKGEVLHFEQCPFSLPNQEDRAFLNAQRLANSLHKNISFNPHTGEAAGYLKESAQQSGRLRDLLADFSQTVTQWVSETFPGYTKGRTLDRVSFRPEEEATRVLRLKARNDLLHVDSFPSRPCFGKRLLRVFVNTSYTDDRLWITSYPFSQLLQMFGSAVGLPTSSHLVGLERWKEGVFRLFKPSRPKRSVYDSFMLKMHDFLKSNETFQEKCRKTRWVFKPGSAWVAMTDACSHAVLRGKSALEHSYFIEVAYCKVPDESPLLLLQRASGLRELHLAA